MAFNINLAEMLESGAYKWELSEDENSYVLKNVIYCSNPEEDAIYYIIKPGFHSFQPDPNAEIGGLSESMFIYVSKDILEGGSINGWNAQNAPIIFQNECSAWKSSNPSTKPDASLLSSGYVVVVCGARGSEAGKNSITEADLSKSPITVVDLKAGVRFLRLNDSVIPGDKNKIISVGGSGGGQMSSILGASGNLEEYYPWLYEIGAAGLTFNDGKYTSTISDSIYGCQCYCPITDIGNADIAYAWLRCDSGETGLTGGGPGNHNGPGSHTQNDMDMNSPGSHVLIDMDIKGKRHEPDGSEVHGHPSGGPQRITFTPFQEALQTDLAQAFCKYINSLGLKNQCGKTLSFPLKSDGTYDVRSGSFYEQQLDNLSNSLNTFLKDFVDADGTVHYIEKGGKPGHHSAPVTASSIDEYFGMFTNTHEWLHKNEDGTYKILSIPGYLNGVSLERNKNIPGFDSFNYTLESNVFGSLSVNSSHFSKSVADVLSENYSKYEHMDGFDKEVVDIYISEATNPLVIEQVNLMASMQVLLDGKSDPAVHWRTRNGSFDEHTAFSIAYTLAMAANQNPKVKSVDYGLIWGLPHSSAEGGASSGSFIGWIEDICR